jgi:hypothetical protein
MTKAVEVDDRGMNDSGGPNRMRREESSGPGCPARRLPEISGYPVKNHPGAGV